MVRRVHQPLSICFPHFVGFSLPIMIAIFAHICIFLDPIPIKCLIDIFDVLGLDFCIQIQNLKVFFSFCFSNGGQNYICLCKSCICYTAWIVDSWTMILFWVLISTCFFIIDNNLSQSFHKMLIHEQHGSWIPWSNMKQTFVPGDCIYLSSLSVKDCSLLLYPELFCEETLEMRLLKR